jgi:predicted membrane protein
LSTRQTNTTICLWGGFFNALLANLIYISGRLIFLATEIGEISSAFVFSTLMHQYSMMSKDYDRHTDLDLAMILFVFLD